MSELEIMLQEADTVAILGHVHPDGDCIGSCLAIYNYIKNYYPEKTADVYLEPAAKKFSYLAGFQQVCHDCLAGKTYDLCVCLDSSDRERLGEFNIYLDTAKQSICIDHHITNRGYTQKQVLEAGSSSTCEVLYGQLDPEKINTSIAECIYTGMIHDTGVFKFSSTSAKTMAIAGKLMEKGIDFGTIIDETFYKKSYLQTQILGRALLESITFLDGRCIFSVVREQDMKFFGVDSKELDGIVDQLRIIDGIECAIFLYETGNHIYKASMRSNSIVDVSKIASYFGGGGHVRAAGCTMSGSIHDVINNLSEHIEKQLQ
ncbi:MAG: bifunctional oligoribonuclease/PAP phosphatase NrnA [Hungatella sp.]